MSMKKSQSAITWFYYDNYDEAVAFYGEVLGLECVLDQGWTKVFRVSSTTYVGLVDAKSGKGSCFAQPKSAVLLTLVVDDVPAWHDKVVEAGATIDRGVVTIEEIEIRGFFFSDPGGYKLEVQEFLNPETRAIFH